MGPNINSVAWESLPSLSANGDLLYFSSNRTGGMGGSDIYVSKRNADGTWSKAEILKGAINTTSNDQAPFIHPDGQTLYFMSNGHPGFGGMDVFFARKTKEGVWDTPVNIGYPINTEKNEGAFYVSLDGSTAFFSKEGTDRKFEKLELSGDAYHAALDIFSFDLYEGARPQPVTYVKAKVLDAVTKQPLQTNATILPLKDGKYFTQKSTGKDGTFLIVLPSGEDYALIVQKEVYLFYSENFSLNGVHKIDQPYELTILLQPISGLSADKQKPIVLKNVFFDTGSALLRKESYSELNLLVELLQKNAALKIELRGHTDNVGSDSENLKLSENRAKAVVAYLVQKGIDTGRLRAKGFGETQPVDSNDTDTGRQNNRRTEFIPF
ncbi:MAG: OmpA family protein [Spirosomaceae bacterium]|nr:OmpA family protein [Spirosomataceae bacterium]